MSILFCILSGSVCYGKKPLYQRVARNVLTLPIYAKIAHNAHNKMVAIAVGDFCVTTIIEYIRVRATLRCFKPQKNMRPLDPEKNPFIARTIAQLAKKAHIKQPSVYLLGNSGMMNAFVSGINPGLVISDELLSVLSADEIEATIAHEIGHIALRHMGAKLPYIALLGALECAIMKMSAKSILAYPDVAYAYILAYEVSFYMLGILMFRAYRRYCELCADSFAAKLTSKPEALISALKKISPEQPKEKAWFTCCKQLSKRLFCTHPSLKTRIKALKKLCKTAPAKMEQIMNIGDA